MKPSIKPIETLAYGRRFRSRLEARWAVFFTALGLLWEYEPEGFIVDGMAYLPDFRVWTPQGEPMWFEVKPACVDSDEKFNRFKEALRSQIQPRDSAVEPRIMLLNGDPCQFLSDKVICPRCSFPLKRQWQDLCSDGSIFYCWHCDCETPSGGGHEIENDGVNGIRYRPDKGSLCLEQHELHMLLSLTNAATVAALSARFEHGCSP